MYNWRQMTDEMRHEVVSLRKRSELPWHGPPHFREKSLFHISAACYEHRPIIGTSPQRIFEFGLNLLADIRKNAEMVLAWCVLPNHYHLLVVTSSLSIITKAIGQLHGRTSRSWNNDEGQRGRKCFHRCNDRKIRSDRHRWATLNYIHHNPVHYGYVRQWQDWPFSSARRYLEQVGREEAQRCWTDYPILDYGKGWDDPDM